MKTITFRPLRRIKKTGKITVASYMQWRKVKTADYNNFKLVVNEEYKTFSKDELVYDHNGENLFWKDFDPEQIPYLPPYILMGENYEYPKRWRTNHDLGCGDSYSARGLDCSGVPTFSHGTQQNLTIGNVYNYTLEEVGEVLKPMSEYELLTVGVVTKWIGWFLWKLDNANIQFGDLK
jgi:hypothetical protein